MVECQRCSRALFLRLPFKGEKTSLPYCPHCITAEDVGWEKGKNLETDEIRRNRWESFLEDVSDRNATSLFDWDYRVVHDTGYTHIEAMCYAISEHEKRNQLQFQGSVIDPETVDEPFGSLYLDHNTDLMIELNANIGKQYEQMENDPDEQALRVFSALLMRRGIDNFLNNDLRNKIAHYLPYTEEELDKIKTGYRYEAIYLLGFHQKDKAQKTFKKVLGFQTRALHRLLQKCPISLPASADHIAF
jgi:hypothetical protein